MFTYTHEYMYYIYIYTCLYVCIYIYIYICICIIDRTHPSPFLRPQGFAQGNIFHTRNHTSEMPLENTTDN